MGPIVRRPLLEMVGDYVDLVQPADGGEIVQHVINHGLAGHRQERLGLGEGEGINARGVTGGKNMFFHMFLLGSTLTC